MVSNPCRLKKNSTLNNLLDEFVRNLSEKLWGRCNSNSLSGLFMHIIAIFLCHFLGSYAMSVFLKPSEIVDNFSKTISGVALIRSIPRNKVAKIFYF